MPDTLLRMWGHSRRLGLQYAIMGGKGRRTEHLLKPLRLANDHTKVAIKSTV